MNQSGSKNGSVGSGLCTTPHPHPKIEYIGDAKQKLPSAPPPVPSLVPSSHALHMAHWPFPLLPYIWNKVRKLAHAHSKLVPCHQSLQALPHLCCLGTQRTLWLPCPRHLLQSIPPPPGSGHRLGFFSCGLRPQTMGKQCYSGAHGSRVVVPRAASSSTSNRFPTGSSTVAAKSAHFF